jgi:hypothetical protein
MRRFVGWTSGPNRSRAQPRCWPLATCWKGHTLREELFAAQNQIFDQRGWIMRGGSIVDGHDHRRTVLY